jgi:UDP-3-O-[3-hydroxymyristoyl] N-acetylglucosamine deacetylase
MEKMHKWERAMGAGLENCIVIDETTDEIMNEFDLYWPDEFVRHKMVDVLGDLMLAGRPIQGRFLGYKPSHKLVHDLLRELPL